LPRLVVDGYNVIHSWADLRSFLDISLEDAREALVQRLAIYALVSGIEVTVVFDAHRSRAAADSVQEAEGVRVIFTAARSADHAIERLAYQARASGNPIEVATSDGFQRALLRGMGAAVIGAPELERRVREAEGELDRRVRLLGR
jgi:predicted RNA-binding protein with PIN domain